MSLPVKTTDQVIKSCPEFKMKLDPELGKYKGGVQTTGGLQTCVFTNER